MSEVKVGQVWEERNGDRLKVFEGNNKDNPLVVIPITPSGSLIGPRIAIDPEKFQRRHKLVQDVDDTGAPATPPAPPPFAPRVGDVVRLKCGGPPMVVSETAEMFNERNGLKPESDEYRKLAADWLTVGRRTAIDAGKVSCWWHDADGNITERWVPTALLVPAEPAGAFGMSMQNQWADSWPPAVADEDLDEAKARFEDALRKSR